jgi:hypothetical protein
MKGATVIKLLLILASVIALVPTTTLKPPSNQIYTFKSYTFTGEYPHTLKDVRLIDTICNGGPRCQPLVDGEQPAFQCSDARSVLFDAVLVSKQVVKMPGGMFAYAGGVTCYPYSTDKNGKQHPAKIIGRGITVLYYADSK